MNQFLPRKAVDNGPEPGTMYKNGGFAVRAGKALRQEAREQFNRNGYYHAKSVFSAAEIARLEEEFDLIVEQLVGARKDMSGRGDGSVTQRLPKSSDTVLHARNVQRCSRLWLDAMLHEGFLELAGAFLGENVVLHDSQLFQKPAGHGAPFPMHQDWHCLSGNPDKMITGIIHVSKATDDMGCLRVWPASHTLGRLEAAQGAQGGHNLGNYPMEGASAIEADPGDAVFFHCLTVHGSKPNRSSHPRKTVLVQMYAGEEKIDEEHFGGRVGEQLVLRGRNFQISRKAAVAPN